MPAVCTLKLCPCKLTAPIRRYKTRKLLSIINNYVPAT